MQVGALTVDKALVRFLDDEVLTADVGVDRERFWRGLDELVQRFGPRNRELLAVRSSLQRTIDGWHREASAPAIDRERWSSIGYLVDDPSPFTVDNGAIDPEIAAVAGPQLVVPVLNARYALNAANARWGSLYDALYGTDALGDRPPSGPYDASRGARVVAWTKAFLDDVVGLDGARHADVVGYRVADRRLEAVTATGAVVGLADPSTFTGFLGDAASPASVLLTHHGLGIELVIDRDHPVGADDAAGVADVRLEAAVTAIVDFEDSVAAVDAADKIAGYRNWLGLMRGDLTEEVTKGGRTFTRRLADDRRFVAPDGGSVEVAGRALLLARNVGLLMTTPAVVDATGAEAYEGLIDAAVTTAIALHDLRAPGGPRNSRAGAVYVVKPKLHGPDEAAFVDEVFAHVEEMLGLPRNTVKVGLMDEERRTSVNLAACIGALRHRIAFINTGFLDRTGDEIHTAMHAGPVVRKAEMREQPWFDAYERSNVEVGLACGLGGRGQIGKGMWAAPDLMSGLLEQKIGHPRAGANCAWVPSPTAATLHATHYHRVDVAAVQRELAAQPAPDRRDDLLRPPLAVREHSADEIWAELSNNCQGILGYAVRWVDQGVGCSKVPDIDDVALMEDRATCRISSQHIANWLLHGIVGLDDVERCLRQMADVVDRQNAGDPAYLPMGPRHDGPAFRAARALILEGAAQPSGYTEPVLHRSRTEVKTAGAARRSPSRLDLAAARRIVGGALAEGAALGLQPLSVAVLDAGGHLVAFEREDGASNHRFQIAFGKAHGALALGVGSRALMERAEAQPYFVAAVTAAIGGALIPVPGGVLITAPGSGEVIGAVGVTGDTSDHDERAAIAGIEGAGLTAVPGAR